MENFATTYDDHLIQKSGEQQRGLVLMAYKSMHFIYYNNIIIII